MFPRHLLLALLLIASPVLAADDVMRYPRAPAGDEFRPLYPLALLQLALDKAASDLRLEPSDYHMEQQRALLSLERGEAVDVVWTMTSIEREQRLLPVRIPLDKGLYGWRIALLRADRAQLHRRRRAARRRRNDVRERHRGSHREHGGVRAGGAALRRRRARRCAYAGR